MMINILIKIARNLSWEATVSFHTLGWATACRTYKKCELSPVPFSSQTNFVAARTNNCIRDCSSREVPERTCRICAFAGAGRKNERKSNCGVDGGRIEWAEKKERCKRTVGSTWVLAWRGEGQFAVRCECFITGKRSPAATEFWMSYRPSLRGARARASVRQSLKTRNWNPLPWEPRRPQIARTNTFVLNRPQFASLYCACTSVSVSLRKARHYAPLFDFPNVTF